MKDLKPTHFPGYDVMAKRKTQSFNNATRKVLDQRLQITDQPEFFTLVEFAILKAVASRIVPQPDNRPAVPIAGLIDHRLVQDQGDGYRTAGMPRQREAWQIGLAALQAESQAAYERDFCTLDGHTQDLLLKRMQKGEMDNPAWRGMPPRQFFKERLSHDIVVAYYAHPTSWNEIGFGGPASPRGYVRMKANEGDPWEAVEIMDGDTDKATRENLRVDR